MKETIVCLETEEGTGVTATARFYEGRPAVMYQRNGDPGLPAEEAVAEVFDFRCKLELGGPSYDFAPTPEQVEAWKNEILENPEKHFPIDF